MDSATNDTLVENGSQHSPKSPSLQERESRGEVSTVATHECTPEHAPKSDVEKLTTNGSSFAARPSFATDPEPLRNLIVNYLPPMMDEEQLWALFGQFGPIESVKIIYDKETRESRGYGFVKYVHFFSASFAANSLNGYCIAGKRLKVAYANVDAAWEAYNLLRASAMMFSSHQQTALQNVFCQQILLARQEEERRRQRRRRRRGFWQEFTKSSMPKTALPAVRGGGISPGKKTLARRTVANHISFDAALFSVACAAGCDVVHAPGDVASILCRLAIDAPHTETGSGAGKNTVLDAEVIILEAVEIVLAGYNDLRLLLSSPSAAKDAEGTAFTSRLMRASLVNLRTLAMFLSQRPPFSSPVLAALFQLTILVVKHAPLEAIDQEGCRVLVSFLELLGCLPRGVEADGLPSIQRVARITARNVMRRVGPRLFISVPPPASPESSGRAACSAVGEYQVDRDLIPWMERHLLPLHVVTGAGAQADLKEDRRLALSLLDFVLLSNDTSSLTDSRRLSMHYLADAVASLLEEEEEEEIGLAGHERDVALAFLNRVDRALSATVAASSIPSSHLTDICKEHLQQPPLTARSIREFLRAKDAAYVSEFTKLHKRIEEEQESQAALQREFAELTEEYDRGQRELEEDILHVFNMEGNPSPSGAIVKGSSPRRVAEETASPSSEKWVQNIMSLLSPVDELTIALHEEQLRHITTM